MQVEKDEEYIKSVTALGAVIEDLVKANNAVDIYEEYFAGKVRNRSAQICRYQAPYLSMIASQHIVSCQDRISIQESAQDIIPT